MEIMRAKLQGHKDRKERNSKPLAVLGMWVGS